MTTARQIVTRAFNELIYLAAGETPTAEDISDGLDALNSLIASWETESIIISYPTGTNWRGAWADKTVYANNDSVSVNGASYLCTVGHDASQFDKPGASANWASYWTYYAETALALGDTFPLPAPFERGVISMLAVEMAPMFGEEPSKFTLQKASEGKTALLAAYMPIAPVRVDNGLIRMPSQIWPYNTDPTS